MEESKKIKMEKENIVTLEEGELELISLIFMVIGCLMTCVIFIVTGIL